jgi:hypothetical protein
MVFLQAPFFVRTFCADPAWALKPRPLYVAMLNLSVFPIAPSLRVKPSFRFPRATLRSTKLFELVLMSSAPFPFADSTLFTSRFEELPLYNVKGSGGSFAPPPVLRDATTPWVGGQEPVQEDV